MDPSVITVCCKCSKGFTYQSILMDSCLSKLAVNGDLVPSNKLKMWEHCPACTQLHVILPVCFRAKHELENEVPVLKSVPVSTGELSINTAQKKWINTAAQSTFGIAMHKIARENRLRCSRELLRIVAEFMLYGGRFKRHTFMTENDTMSFHFEKWSAAADMFAEQVFRPELTRKRAYSC